MYFEIAGDNKGKNDTEEKYQQIDYQKVSSAYCCIGKKGGTNEIMPNFKLVFSSIFNILPPICQLLEENLSKITNLLQRYYIHNSVCNKNEKYKQRWVDFFGNFFL